MKAFLAKGCEVVAIGNEPESVWSEKFSKKNIRYVQISVERTGMNPVSEQKAYRSIKKVLKDEMPDKVFAYQAKTVIYGGVAAYKLGIKEFYPLIAGLGSVFMKEGLKAEFYKKLLRMQYKSGLRHAKKVFFQNSEDVEYFTERCLVHKGDIVMTPGSGVNTERFKVQTLPKRPAFICVSRIIRDKGVVEYLEAAKIAKAKYPDTRFLLVGPYDTNPSALKPRDLAPYIEENIIEYFGEQEEVRPYYGQASVCVLPSYREGVPKTVLEAMASGRAIITTDAPGCRETVEYGRNGFLVPVRCAEAVAEKMEYFINNPEEIAKMGAEGRKMAEEKFDVNIVNGIILEAMDIV